MSPLHAAAWNSSCATTTSVVVVKLLLENSADVSAKDAAGRTPLHVAARRGNVDVVHLLLHHHACMSPKDVLGKTPLVVAADLGQKQVVQVLMEHGAVMDNTKEKTLLQRATQKKTVRVLIERAAANERVHSYQVLIDRTAALLDKDTKGKKEDAQLGQRTASGARGGDAGENGALAADQV